MKQRLSNRCVRHEPVVAGARKKRNPGTRNNSPPVCGGGVDLLASAVGLTTAICGGARLQSNRATSLIALPAKLSHLSYGNFTISEHRVGENKLAFSDHELLRVQAAEIVEENGPTSRC